jgi:serine/threonine protein phosphatase 1
MILRRLLTRKSRASDAPLPPPMPERACYAVGDLHGRSDLLDLMLRAISADAGDQAHDIVFLGDYVDRGPDSAGVLLRLQALESGQDNVTCLMGNHDRMLLDFTVAPLMETRWLMNGGDATLASFGIAESRVSDQGLALSETLGVGRSDSLAGWLEARPLWWRSGSVIAVHALTDPRASMEEQDDDTLLWARPGRRLVPRSDGAWVVHGHTIVDAPEIREGHVAIDTGAFRSGTLTAAVFAPGKEIRFLQVTAEWGPGRAG